MAEAPAFEPPTPSLHPPAPLRPLPPPPPSPTSPAGSSRPVRRWLVPGLVICLAIALLVVAIFIVWSFGVSETFRSLSNDFFEEVDRRDFIAAEALTHPDCRLTAEIIEAKADGLGLPHEWVTSDKAEGTARWNRRIEIPGFRRIIEVSFRQLGDEWRVCDFSRT